MIPDPIIDALDRRLSEPGRPLVAITGPVASGKTTLAAAIAARHATEALSTDEYLPDYDDVPRLERDSPQHADLTRLKADLQALKSGRETLLPVWSFFEHKRTRDRPFEPGPVVVVEGLFALHPSLAPIIDLGIFVDGPVETRRERFVARSIDGERGFPVDVAEAHFDEVAEPTLWKHAPEYYPQATFRFTQDGSGGFRPL
ncbi:MAG: hypothetical protein AAGI53_00115 [Planctomycetota bacterium]